VTPRRVGVVGCGLIGQKRADALPPVLQLVAAFDADRQRAERLLAKSGLDGEVSSGVEALCRTVGPDGLVIVATTHDALADVAEAAATLGCHVLIEKPGARRPDELRRVAAAAATRGVTVRIGFNHRFHPAIRQVREAVASGDHGELLLIRGRYGHGGRVGYEREWRADATRSGGGELLDQGVHLIDLALALGGQAVLRYAALDTLFWPMDVEDNAFLHLTVGDRGHAWLHATWTEWKNMFSLEVTCRRTKFEITGLGGSYGPERLARYAMSEQMGPPMTTVWEWPPGDGSWAAELADVVAAIDGRPAIGTSLSEGVEVLDIVEEAYAQ
jgi:predicted dehydrogenase